MHSPGVREYKLSGLPRADGHMSFDSPTTFTCTFTFTFASKLPSITEFMLTGVANRKCSSEKTRQSSELTALMHLKRSSKTLPHLSTPRMQQRASVMSFQWSGAVKPTSMGAKICGRRRSRPCSSLVDAVMLAFSHRCLSLVAHLLLLLD